MTKKTKKARTNISPILNAAIEDAFDECNTPDQMSELSKQIIEKMTQIYWKKKNFNEDHLEDD